MIAFKTKFVGPTNFKGARIIVKDGNGKRTIVSYEYGDNEPHNIAVLEHIHKHYPSVTGSTLTRGQIDNSGYVYVFTDGTGIVV